MPLKFIGNTMIYKLGDESLLTLVSDKENCDE